MAELSTYDYNDRTRENIKDSDGTLILIIDAMDTGSKLTLSIARELKKPYLLAILDDDNLAALINKWIIKNKISVLNIAGPRESSSPGIYKKTLATLSRIF